MEFDIAALGGYGTGSLGNVTISGDRYTRGYSVGINPHEYLKEWTTGNIYPEGLTVGGATISLEYAPPSPRGNVGSAFLFVQMSHKKELDNEELTVEELAGYGKYEVRTITAIDGYNYTLDQAPAMDFANYYVQIVPFLDFENLTLNSGGCFSLAYHAEGEAEGILAVRVKDTLTLNGGHIDLFSPGYIFGSRNVLTAQEQNGALDADAQAGQENFITKDRFLLNGGHEGGLFLLAKNIVVESADSRIGVGFSLWPTSDDHFFIPGVQYCRGAADSPNRPTNLTITVENSEFNGVYATNKSGATILIACETFEGFTPALIAKYSMYQDPNNGDFSDYGYGKGLARCYIACKNPPSTLIEDGMLYYLDADTAEENENRLQGFEIQIAEQQITETVTFTAAAPFEILQQTAGQFLDYKYNLRIESITQRGILYTCRCCTNLEEILYSQLEYSVPEVSRKERTWHLVGGHTTYDEPERANASGHVEAIAGALGIAYKNQFDDFVSTVEVERGGSTYADTIRELFGWSARIPTLLINAFIRDNCLYVIQRGHEERVIDISNAKITLPIFTRELVRTYWGETPYLNTEVRTVSCIVNNFQADDDETDTGETGMFKIREPSAPLRQQEITKTATGSIEKSYYYDAHGLLLKTIETTKNAEEEATGKSITVYEYEGYGDYLKEETMTIYDKTGAITEKRVVTYSPTGAGQAAAVGKINDSETFLNTVRDIPPSEMPSPYALNKNFHDLQEADPEFRAQKQARQEERLVPGIVPFDTSFPVVGDDKLIEITNAIKDLNRRTKETVTLTLYDYEHLIDFNDRILLYGAEYFLVSNTLTTTPHVRDQQSLVLVRWY